MLYEIVVARLTFLKPREQALLFAQFPTLDALKTVSRCDIERLLGRQLDTRHGARPRHGARLNRHEWDIEGLAAKAEKDAPRAEAQGIRVIRLTDGAYPPQLKEIHDPPAVLFYRGELSAFNAPFLGIVGTRRPSTAACAATRTLARDAAEAGVDTVSGLAYGIDAMAHRGCIDGGGKTIAILGSGIDTVTPTGNADLARRILRTGGCIASEYPPGMQGSTWQFPARNRIIAGLSRGILVAEAPEKSGALITARDALQEGRDVFVLRDTREAGGDSAPTRGSPTDTERCHPRAPTRGSPTGAESLFEGELPPVFGAGCRRLAEDGAPVVESAACILRDWGIEVGLDQKTENRYTEREGVEINALARELGVD